MIRAHKIKLNPTPEQEIYFRKACGCSRLAFNWMLAEWKKRYESGEKSTAISMTKAFRSVKGELFPFMAEVTKCVVDGARIDIGSAFSNFFREAKSGKVGYPKFKSKHRSKPAFYLANDKFSVDKHILHVPKLGPVNITEPLRLTGKILSGRISFKAGYWWVAIQVELPDLSAAAHTGPAIGVDLGLKELAVCSDGRRFPNPKHLQTGLRKIKSLSRSLSRKVQGSANWLKAKAKLARAHYRIACKRSDAIHKMTTELSRSASLIGMEDLNVKDMVQNRRRARSISDAVWGEIKRQLLYKVPDRVVEIDRWFPSSRLCGACGVVNQDLTLADRTWTCPCGREHDRDLNASVNIRDEAIRILKLVPVVATSGL